jgi:hypothetical protein
LEEAQNYCPGRWIIEEVEGDQVDQVVDAVSEEWVSDTVITHPIHFFKEIDLFAFPRAATTWLWASATSQPRFLGHFLKSISLRTKSISPNKQFNYS